MEIKPGLKVIVYAGTWFNKKIKGKWAIPLSGKIISSNGTLATVDADAREFSKKPLFTRQFWYNEVYIAEDFERGLFVTLNDYIALPIPGPTDPEECTCCVKLSKRMLDLEKKLELLTTHVHNRYRVNSTIPTGDL